MFGKKIPLEEPKYNCIGNVDGTKVYYYFNPPDIGEGKQCKKDGIVMLVVGILLLIVPIILLILLRNFLKYFFWIWYIAGVIILIGLGVVGIAYLKIRKGTKIVEERTKKIVTDEEYSKIKTSVWSYIVENAKRAMNLQENEKLIMPPMNIMITPISQEEKVVIRKDGKMESTEGLITSFYFLEDSIFIHKYKYSMRNTDTSEETLTLFYRDIYSVEVCNNASKGYQELIIDSCGKEYRYLYFDSQDMRDSINAFRSLIRMKRR